ncbi:transposase [Spirosoma flavum]|uniref:Transposase n=1 Tax=Spirosoma flavum TaxID=2048557 RepID=A0ABW6AGE9_9BACT
MTSQWQPLTDYQWAAISPFFNLKRKRKHDLRQIMDAILWLLRTGCHGAARAVAKPTALLAALASDLLLPHRRPGLTSGKKPTFLKASMQHLTNWTVNRQDVCPCLPHCALTHSLLS